MNHSPAPHPVDEARRIGTVTVATAQWVTINLPNGGAAGPFAHHGDAVPRGEVGEYVCFPRSRMIVLGRITRVELPERDRLSLEPSIGRAKPVDPIGSVTLLTEVDLRSGEASGAVSVPPRLGTAVYSVSSAFLKWVVDSGTRMGASNSVALRIGHVAGVTETPVSVSPERLFGRHCAVLGVTGGGKSWTISRLIEECSKHRSKVILVDATGEFMTLDDRVMHCSIGSEKDLPEASIRVSCPYHKLDNRDLFALFTPSGQSQGPIMREAIRSLKLAQCAGLPPGMVDEHGDIPKARKVKEPFLKKCKEHISTIESSFSGFAIDRLSSQLQKECVSPTGDSDKNWGPLDLKTIGYCMSLIMRVESMVKDEAFAPLLQPNGVESIQEVIDRFMLDEDARVLRISLRFLSFSHAVRPIVVNAIGRHLLQKARKSAFRLRPTLVVLDEAHQFLGKWIGEENNSFALDAFDLIAKEGRKYGLTVCLATQRPRDIQEGVLSQMGAMIVHRLTHSADREVVERAARDVEKSAATLLPTLAPGQALLLGADFPVPIPIQILEPSRRPESKGPNYQDHWARDLGAEPPIASDNSPLVGDEMVTLDHNAKL